MADTITPKVPIAISASLNVDDVKVLARSTEAVPDTANRMDQRIGGLAAPAGGPRHQVDREIADPQDGLLNDGVAASAKRLDARQQFDERKRLDQIVIAPGAQATHPIVDLSERTDDQDGCGDAVVAQLTHDRDAIDVRKHAVNRDHGIVAGDAAAQRLVAAGGQIHLVTAGGERIHDLASGFRVVLDDQNTAVTSRHGLASPNGWPKAEISLERSESRQPRIY